MGRKTKESSLPPVYMTTKKWLFFLTKNWTISKPESALSSLHAVCHLIDSVFCYTTSLGPLLWGLYVASPISESLENTRSIQWPGDLELFWETFPVYWSISEIYEMLVCVWLLPSLNATLRHRVVFTCKAVWFWLNLHCSGQGTGWYFPYGIFFCKHPFYGSSIT